MTNTVLETIAQRYTARSYTGEPIPHGDLEKIALAGLQAPSSMNRQRWEIHVIENPELLAELEKAAMTRIDSDPKLERFSKSIASRGGSVFYGAPAVINLYYNGSDAEDVKSYDSCALDCGIVIENMAIAASGLGYGNCICGLMRNALDGNEAEFNAKLNVTEGYEFAISLLVGKTNTEPTPHKLKEEKLIWN